MFRKAKSLPERFQPRIAAQRGEFGVMEIPADANWAQARVNRTIQRLEGPVLVA